MSGLIVGLINFGGGSGTSLTGLGTDNTVARWDGTDTIQSSGWTLDDSDVLTAGGTLDVSGNDIQGVAMLKDASNLNILELDSNGSGDNWVEIFNNVSPNPPIIQPAGADADLSVRASTGGTLHLDAGTGTATLEITSTLANVTQALTVAGTITANDSLDVNSDLTLSSSSDIVFTEKADHSETPAAGFGYLWVKNDTPNSLIFTDDAGTDYDLTAAGSGTVGGTGTDNNLARWDGTGDIQDSGWALDDSNVLTAGGTLDMNNNQINGLDNLYGGTDGRVLNFVDVGSGSDANYISIGNRGTTQPPFINAIGSDANVDLYLGTKGTGAVTLDGCNLDANSGDIVGVNSLQLDNASDGGIEFLQASGRITFDASDDGDTFIENPGSFSNDTLQVTCNGSVVLDIDSTRLNVQQGLTVDGSATLGSASDLIFTEKADHTSTPGAGFGYLWVKSDTPNTLIFTDDAGTDHDLTAGGGISNVVEDTSPQLGGMLDVNGNALGDGTLELLTFTETASAVNHVDVKNATTGNKPGISAAGDDTNITLQLTGKGTGAVRSDSVLEVTSGSVAAPSVTFAGDTDNGVYRHGANQFGIAVQGDEGLVVNSASASAVNYLQVNNAITANGPELVAAGSDSNIDLELLPKGTGEVIIADCEFSGGVAYQSTALTSGAGTKTMDGNTAADYTYEQSGASPTFAAPTNVVVGQRFSLEITDTTGNGTITWNAAFEWEGGTAPADLAAGETRQIDFRVAAVSGTTATRVSGFYSGTIS